MVNDMDYFSELVSINKIVCGEESGVRKNYDFQNDINTLVDKILNNNDNDIVYRCLNIASIIKLLQPFYDGNNRTALIYFGNLLEKNGYDFDYDSALYDMSKHKLTIPVIYNEDDKIGIKSVEVFDNYIIKYEHVR